MARTWIIPARVVAGVVLVTGAVCTRADTIVISDQFHRGASNAMVALNGAAPDHVQSPGDVWHASSTSMTDGSQVVLTSDLVTDVVPFQIAPGAVYTLTADVSPSSTGTTTQGIEVGFLPSLASNTTSSAAFNDGVNQAGPWVEILGDGTVKVYGGPGTDAQQTVPAGITGTIGGDTQVQITLDTTDSDWDATFYINGTVVDGYSYSATDLSKSPNPTINTVGFGDTGQAGTVSSFQLLTSAVPEPAGCWLLMIGTLPLLRRRCR